MKKRVDAQPELPNPAKSPQAPPNPPARAWWIDPCQPAQGIAQRYHDGSKWTSYVSELCGSEWHDIRERPYSPPPHDSEIWLSSGASENPGVPA